MDIITRNFFRLLRSGALNEYEALEPMSPFKWGKLSRMVHAQHVEEAAHKGMRNSQYDPLTPIPTNILEEMTVQKTPTPHARLSNGILNRRMANIEKNERHAIDTNVGALDVLHIIVDNVSSMLNQGQMLKGIIQLGAYLRTKGDKVDFVKLEAWLHKLHLRRMAQLQGCMLMEVFAFEQDELPFVEHREPSAGGLVLRSVLHTVSDNEEVWHFRQTRTGFVQSNTTMLQRNLRRSLRYITYAPLETISNFFNNFARSLQEIEE